MVYISEHVMDRNGPRKYREIIPYRGRSMCRDREARNMNIAQGIV